MGFLGHHKRASHITCRQTDSAPCQVETLEDRQMLNGIIGSETLIGEAPVIDQATPIHFGNSRLFGQTGNNFWAAANSNMFRPTEYATWLAWTSSKTFIQRLTGDFNGDGIDDIALLSEDKYWYVGLSSSGSGMRWSNWGGPFTGNNIKEVHVADLNGDGKDDIFGFAEYNNNTVIRIFRSSGYSFTQFGGAIYSNSIGTISNVLVTDAGNQGDNIFVITTTGTIWRYQFSNSSGLASFAGRLSGFYDRIQAGDVDGDGSPDLITVTGSFQNYVFSTYKLENSEFTRSYSGRITALSSFDEFVVGDFNGDHQDDVAALINGNKLWVGVSDGTQFNLSLWSSLSLTGGGYYDFYVDDVDRNSTPDIVIRDHDSRWLGLVSYSSRFYQKILAQWDGTANWSMTSDNQPTFVLFGLLAPEKEETERLFGHSALLDFLAAL
ncbi:MAG: VCBS repeat-containing protein [Planctomycetaceae bacterium]|nr:VCBS repeat-containing protein [Planctomycetaceae bacterium]